VDDAGQRGCSPRGIRTGDFFVCDIFDCLRPRTTWPRWSIRSSRSPPGPTGASSYAHNGAEITVTPSVKGRATIHDKDILIYCISQLMAALNAGRQVSRTLHAHGA
jgi:hypothetical protein